MKRVKYACLEQTIAFTLKEDISRAEAEVELKNELAAYKERMTKSLTKFKIIEEVPQADGSVLLKVKKQYNSYNCGDYLE